MPELFERLFWIVSEIKIMINNRHEVFFFTFQKQHSLLVLRERQGILLDYQYSVQLRRIQLPVIEILMTRYHLAGMQGQTKQQRVNVDPDSPIVRLRT